MNLDTKFFFIVCMKSFKDCYDLKEWEHINKLLHYSLETVLANEKANAIVCTDIMPLTPLMQSKRISFVSASHLDKISFLDNFSSPNQVLTTRRIFQLNFRKNKSLKFNILKNYIRNLINEYKEIYVMPLDADDLVSKDLVDYTKQKKGTSFYMTKGFFFDYKTGKSFETKGNEKIKKMGGGGGPDRPFYAGCGSSIIYYFSLETLKNNHYDILFTSAHTRAPQIIKNLNYNIEPIDRPMVISVLNHESGITYASNARYKRQIIYLSKSGVDKNLTKNFVCKIFENYQ